MIIETQTFRNEKSDMEQSLRNEDFVGSTMHGQVIWSTDDNELARALEQMKPAFFHFSNHRLAPDFAFHIANSAPDDTASARSLRAEQMMKESGVSANKAGCAKL